MIEGVNICYHCENYSMIKEFYCSTCYAKTFGKLTDANALIEELKKEIKELKSSLRKKAKELLAIEQGSFKLGDEPEESA